MGRVVLPSPHNGYVGTATTYDLAGGLESQERVALKAASVGGLGGGGRGGGLGQSAFIGDKGEAVRAGEPGAGGAESGVGGWRGR